VKNEIHVQQASVYVDVD